MNETEHMISLLGEECDEVGQRCSKANRFGLTESYQGETNAESIVREAKDVITVLVILRQRGLIPDFMPTRQEHEDKVARIKKYMDYSRECGTLTDD